MENFQKLRELRPSFFDAKVLVITSCTAKKLGDDKETIAKAKDMYQGRIVKSTRSLTEKYGLDWKIISAKYGILDPEDEIHGYDKKLNSKKEAEELRPKVIPQLREKITNYEKIIVFAGKHYREVLEPILDNRFYALNSKGYGDLCAKIKACYK